MSVMVWYFRCWCLGGRCHYLMFLNMSPPPRLPLSFSSSANSGITGGGVPIDLDGVEAVPLPEKKLDLLLAGCSPDLLKRLNHPPARFVVRSPMRLNPPRLWGRSLVRVGSVWLAGILFPSLKSPFSFDLLRNRRRLPCRVDCAGLNGASPTRGTSPVSSAFTCALLIGGV